MGFITYIKMSLCFVLETWLILDIRDKERGNVQSEPEIFYSVGRKVTKTFGSYQRTSEGNLNKHILVKNEII